MKLHKNNKLKNKLDPMPNKEKSKLIMENYDFDFSLYEQEDKEDSNVDSIKKLNENKPIITNLRSKFGNSLQLLEILLKLREKIIMYGIKVGSNTEDLRSLWKFYGCISEYWANIKDIFGSIIIKEVETKKNECWELMIKYTDNNIQNPIVNKKLLELRDNIYLISQRANLGIEVEKIYSSRNNAKKGIIE